MVFRVVECFFRVLGLIVLEVNKDLALRRDLSMSKDMRDQHGKTSGLQRT